MQIYANRFMTPDAVVIYPSRGKILMLLLGAAGFVALSIFLWKTGQIKNEIIAVASALFFGACLILGLARLLWRRPALVINWVGIFVDAGGLAGYSLAWDDIESIYISSIRTSAFGRAQRFLSFRLKNVDAFMNRQTALSVGLMKLNVALVGAPLSISGNTLSLTLEELIGIIREKCPALNILQQ